MELWLECEKIGCKEQNFENQIRLTNPNIVHAKF